MAGEGTPWRVDESKFAKLKDKVVVLTGTIPYND
jgi:hypothetical protein